MPATGDGQMEIFTAVAGSTYGVHVNFITKASIYSCYIAMNFPLELGLFLLNALSF